MRNQSDTLRDGTNGAWHVEITTPDGACLRPTATQVDLTTMDGQIGVMPGHERTLTVLDVGELVIHHGDQREVMLLGGGFAQITPGRLSVLAFSIEHASDDVALERCHARRQELLGDDAIGQE
jgi:F-type H+-transporting ATPase subunit epsilon